MRIDARGVLAKLREICAVLVQEGIKVCLRSPVGIVDDPSTVGALVQGCSDIARLSPYGFGEANPLINVTRSRSLVISIDFSSRILGSAALLGFINTAFILPTDCPYVKNTLSVITTHDSIRDSNLPPCPSTF
jgi:hypothetical protein